MKRSTETIILLIAIGIILLLRLHVVVVRFIDPDEFAHLHWAYLLVSGNVPYRDFFLYHIPLYQLYLAPIFFLPKSSFLLYLARVWEFCFYLLAVALLAKLSFIFSKNNRVVLLTVLLFLVFPMTIDKTIDVRPDMLMVVFFLFSVYLTETSHGLTRTRLFTIGLSLGLSVMVFPKIIFALPSLFFLLFSKLKPTPGVGNGLIRRFIFTWPVAIGSLIPFLIFSFFLVITGTFAKGIELVTQGAWAVSAGKIPFSPWLAISPWPVIYVGRGGPSIPWIFNTALWILAIGGLPALWKINKQAMIFLCIFFGGGILFLFAFPAPYIQYFVPLSVFVSLLAATLLDSVLSVVDSVIKTKFKVSIVLVIAILCISASSFFIQYKERAEATSEEQVGVIDTVARIVRPDETMYDMVGSYLIRPDGYYICCHPYAEFVDKLKTKPPSLPESLIRNNTKFVVLDRTGLAFWKPLPEDLQFLFKHYIESPHKKIYVLGAKFICVNGSCNQVDINNRPITSGTTSFDIIIAENYVIETVPPNQPVPINGSVMNNAPLAFSPGLYSFSLPPSVSLFQVRLAR